MPAKSWKASHCPIRKGVLALKHLILAGAAVTLLVACGGGGSSDRAALMENCTSSGEGDEACTCIVDSMEKNLSPAVFAKVAEAARSEGKDPSDMVASLPLEQQQEFIKLLPDMMSCAAVAAEN